ncbi:hypothetical protein DFS34DRAFT_648721 [Phlyctochytrium arcticum]|nr:hypothetical protein DFS34DRAFT_648721 [Phlyctochytrium arcticum]
MARYGSGYNKGFGPHEAAALAAASSASVSTTSLPGTSPDSPVRSASISTPTSPSGRRSSVALTIASGSHSPYIHPPYAASHDSVASTMHTSETAKDIRFTVEVQKIKNLPGLFVVEFKRLKGDVWDFKRLYQEAIVGMENVVGVAAIGRR